MINSIQHFLENGTLKLEKAQINFFKNPSQLDSLIEETKQVILSFALDFFRETLEECDEAIRNSDIRKQSFTIVRKDTKTLFTTLGSFSFQKTLFLEKHTNKHCYLLDQLLELEPYTRITNEAVACMIESVANSSYQETANQVSLGDFLSKQTVKNKVHSLDFSNPSQVQKEKKTIDFLYIDADEDHVALQFRNQKGDLKKEDGTRKGNTQLAKLIYVYEGKTNVSFSRKKLLNPHYFCGTYRGKQGNQALFEEVSNYIKQTYEEDSIQQIYFNGDGGSWMKSGIQTLGATLVLDEFHIQKYVKQLLSYVTKEKEEREILRQKLLSFLKQGKRKAFCQWIEETLSSISQEETKNKILKKANYLWNHFPAIKLRLQESDSILGSSTESHVSHVLSNRLSSRPLGWSRHGIDQMAHIRAYSFNQGDFHALISRQKRKQAKVCPKKEELCLSASQILSSTQNKLGDIGKYFDKTRATLSPTISKMVYFQHHIWKLC